MSGRRAPSAAGGPLRGFSLRRFAPRRFAFRRFSLHRFTLRGFASCGFSLHRFSLHRFTLRGFAPRGFSLRRFAPRRFTPGALSPRGFTLIELLIVLLIVGILGAVAVPAWRQYALRAHRTEAKTALLRLAANQERHYLQNNTYSDDPVVLGFAAGASEGGLYTLSIPVADATTWQAAATPTPGGGPAGIDMSRDEACLRFTIDAAGRRGAFPDPHGTCW